MTEQWSVRCASAADLPALLAIERACTETSHWSETAWRLMLETTQPGTAARAVFVAHRVDEVLGFAVAQSAAGSAELESVAVKVGARGSGVGRALGCAAMAWAAERAATEMHLEVRESNAVARRMYGALGFVEQGRRRSYYREPVEDAVVMVRRLDGAVP